MPLRGCGRSSWLPLTWLWACPVMKTKVPRISSFVKMSFGSVSRVLAGMAAGYGRSVESAIAAVVAPYDEDSSSNNQTADAGSDGAEITNDTPGKTAKAYEVADTTKSLEEGNEQERSNKHGLGDWSDEEAMEDKGEVDNAEKPELDAGSTDELKVPPSNEGRVGPTANDNI
jgi:hypothetical protein